MKNFLQSFKSFFFSNESSTSFVEGISSSYDEFLDLIEFKLEPKVIVEIGTFNAGGTETLINRFGEAQIYTYELENPYEQEHVNLEELSKKLHGRAELIIQTSPPLEFNKKIDLCVFDIGSKFENIWQNFEFWFNHLNPGGRLVMLVPWSTPQKRKMRELVLTSLDRKSLKYNEIVNWVIVVKE